MVNIRKVGIIGCGFVGSTAAFTLMKSGLFSEMVLIDINRRKAEGEAMDLSHALPFLSPMEIFAGEYRDLSDCAIIIITAGTNQKVGETRIDLVNRNIKILRSVVGEIIKYNNEAILLVVSNPVDILSYVTYRLSGFPASRVIGSGTVLDTARLKYLVGRDMQVDSRNVHTFIIGEHGDSELAVWSSANISGIDLDEYCSICGKCPGLESIYRMYDEVKNSAYEIIEAKGATYYAIGEAVGRICASIVRDEDSIMPVSVLLEGQYGLDDIYLGIPSIIGSGGVKRILQIPLDEGERRRLALSAEMLHDVLSKTDIFEPAEM